MSKPSKLKLLCKNPNISELQHFR